MSHEERLRLARRGKRAEGDEVQRSVRQNDEAPPAGQALVERSEDRLREVPRYACRRLPGRRLVAVRQGGHHPAGELFDLLPPGEDVGRHGLPIHRPGEASRLGQEVDDEERVPVGQGLDLGQGGEGRWPCRSHGQPVELQRPRAEGRVDLGEARVAGLLSRDGSAALLQRLDLRQQRRPLSLRVGILLGAAAHVVHQVPGPGSLRDLQGLAGVTRRRLKAVQLHQQAHQLLVGVEPGGQERAPAQRAAQPRAHGLDEADGLLGVLPRRTQVAQPPFGAAQAHEGVDLAVRVSACRQQLTSPLQARPGARVGAGLQVERAQVGQGVAFVAPAS
ncbi:MAG TPA: hypothetical protein VIA62_27190 [Thermoanaerobaculia bacterium]|nr:hypothetical protein [Thermoanaerobaculia bacterium]